MRVVIPAPTDSASHAHGRETDCLGVERLGERRTAIVGLACAGACLLAYAFTPHGWQVHAFFLVGALGALAYPAMNGILSRMVDASRQGALQGGVGSMNSVAAVLGPLIASQSLAWGAARGFDGAAFRRGGAAAAQCHDDHRAPGATPPRAGRTVRARQRNPSAIRFRRMKQLRPARPRRNLVRKPSAPSRPLS